jgi:hypothetical protein
MFTLSTWEGKYGFDKQGCVRAKRHSILINDGIVVTFLAFFKYIAKEGSIQETINITKVFKFRRQE